MSIDRSESRKREIIKITHKKKYVNELKLKIRKYGEHIAYSKLDRVTGIGRGKEKMIKINAGDNEI